MTQMFVEGRTHPLPQAVLTRNGCHALSTSVMPRFLMTFIAPAVGEAVGFVRNAIRKLVRPSGNVLSSQRARSL